MKFAAACWHHRRQESRRAKAATTAFTNISAGFHGVYTDVHHNTLIT
ncbi:hypothetical protein IZU99_00965 [Oscillospiraceae bacterium CM]|nr:hypothetical protein IZU99_00965 [Oscillospiraceae bacterium CM]